MSNNTTRDQLDMRNPTYAALFGSVTVLGLPFNIVSLWILVRHHSQKSPTNVLMVNLVISDTLLIVSLPMRIYFYATGTWPLNNVACIIFTMLFQNNIRSSSTFITCVSIDRLLAVVYPLKSSHLRTASNAKKCVAIIWLLLCVVNIPESVKFSRNMDNFNATTCFEFHHEQLWQPPLLYLQPVLVLILLAINVVSTALVCWKLHRHLQDSVVKNKVNVMLIFVLNLMMFVVCFLPLSLIVLIKSREYTSLICLASVNCCLDPLLYYFSFDGFYKKKSDASTFLRPEQLMTLTN
ncbi:lysophosphatidic acid receptor 5b [Aulostomus maculatus]